MSKPTVQEWVWFVPGDWVVLKRDKSSNCRLVATRSSNKLRVVAELPATVDDGGVTGNGEEKDIEHYKSQGATAVFVKPFDMNKFVRHMKELEFLKSKR